MLQKSYHRCFREGTGNRVQQYIYLSDHQYIQTAFGRLQLQNKATEEHQNLELNLIIIPACHHSETLVVTRSNRSDSSLFLCLMLSMMPCVLVNMDSINFVSASSSGRVANSHTFCVRHAFRHPALLMLTYVMP